MPDERITTVIEQAKDLTVQSRIDQPVMGGNVFLVNWIAKSGATVSPWWSQTRDMQLRDFWKASDHLAGAVYTIQAKMTAIPFRVEPKDRSIQEHVEQADRITDIIYSAAEFGDGWVAFYSKWIEDLLTQDNGAFAEIIGPGDPSGPLTGMPISIAHLDSLRCTRTGNAEYPVVYEDLDGKSYKLHYTRVLFASQMPSPIADMYGVGLCSVSRCVNVAQTLVDMLTFKQEKMGSRPHRKILVAKGGLDPKDLKTAFELAESTMDSQGLTRYSKTVVVGSSTLMESAIDQVDLSALPDGFDENTSTILGMAAIALAFGVDARELFPSLGAGATRAEALLQHLKQRGKAPGQILQVTETLFNHKFLPPHLKMVFDFQDDAQDRQVADIRRVRAERRQIDANTGALDIRTMREQMLADGDIDRGQFERLELRDGRLPNGASVLSLFYSKDPTMGELLNLNVADPLDIEANLNGNKTKQVEPTDDEGEPNVPDATTTLPIVTKIRQAMKDANKVLIAARTDATRWTATQAVTALAFLEQAYLAGDLSPFTPDVQKLKPQGRTPVHREQRRLNPGEPTDQDQRQREDLKPDTDETDLIE